MSAYAVEVVNLSNNSFTGQIPADIDRLVSLQQADLSGNDFAPRDGLPGSLVVDRWALLLLCLLDTVACMHGPKELLGCEHPLVCLTDILSVSAVILHQWFKRLQAAWRSSPFLSSHLVASCTASLA